jgi:hypothetical protein
VIQHLLQDGGEFFWRVCGVYASVHPGRQGIDVVTAQQYDGNARVNRSQSSCQVKAAAPPRPPIKDDSGNGVHHKQQRNPLGTVVGAHNVIASGLDGRRYQATVGALSPGY